MAYAFFGRRARASVKGESREDGGSQWIRNENEKQKAKGRSNRVMVLHRLRRSLGDEFKLRSRNKTERGWWKYVDKKRKREANKISPFSISASIFSCSSHVTCHIYKVHRTDYESYL